MHPNLPKVLVADDQAVVAEGITRILEYTADVVAYARTGPEAVRLATETGVDIVILDVLLPDLGGLEVGRRLLKLEPSPRVLYLSSVSDPEFVTEARHLGAHGFLPKSCERDELITAVEIILDGGSYLSTALADAPAVLKHGLEEHSTEKEPVPLTARQQQVLRLVAEGLSGKEIAHRLCISPKTVEFHKAAITAQLELRSTAELVRYALAHNLLDEPETTLK